MGSAVRRARARRESHRTVVRLVTFCVMVGCLLWWASSASAGLPDSRVYEMVTPPGNQNADVYLPPGQLNGESLFTGIGSYEGAADGDAVSYVASPTSEGNGSAGGGGGDQYLATRLPGGGWTQTTLTPTHTVFDEYEAFSPDLTVGIIDGDHAELATLSPEVPPPPPGHRGYNMLYTRTFADGVLHPFYTEKPPDYAEHPYPYGTFGYETLGVGRSLAYAGSSENLGHLLFEANDALGVNPLGGVSPIYGGEEENNLYDSVNGQLQLVNVLPDGSTEPNATFGAPAFALFSSYNNEQPDFSRVISADGSRIFWSTVESEAEERFAPKALYVRESDTQPQSPIGPKGECTVPTDACTVQVDASQGPLGTSGGGRFWTASSDGSKVFFTDCKRLTNDSTAVFTVTGCINREQGEWKPEGSDLYEYDVHTGKLIDLTVDGNASDPLGADVQGVIGASEDGEYVYFVADGVLASGAVGGQPNLYLGHGGVTTFIATLSPADDHVQPSDNGEVGDWRPGVGRRTADVTPDGHSIVFISKDSLTDYPSEGSWEVYVYDAESEKLFCASCDPNGEPPPVPRAAAAYLPFGESLTYQPRVISEDGSRVFFDTPEPLVAHDTNGLPDVYEWERQGSNGCEQGGGCVYLLSGGTSTDDSLLLDASANGEDVFMITRAQLVPQDLDENYKLYDARADGPRPLTPQACSGTGCQGVPSVPPTFATPASVTYEGVGNFSAPGVKATVKPKPKPKHKAKRHKARSGKRGRKASRSAGVLKSEGRSGR
jgi:hypothetical protein